jgi:catechol 2,3-dioxygenase
MDKRTPMDRDGITEEVVRAIDPATRPGLVALHVDDLQRVRDFYRGVLGLAERPAPLGEALLGPQTGEPLVRLESGAQAQARVARSTGLYHMALLYPSRAALGAALLRLDASGYPIQGASDHGVSEAIYLADPEGNGIELYADRPKASWPRRGDTLEMVTAPLDLESLANVAQAAGMQNDEWVSDLRMGHIHLHVAQLEPAVAFYHQGLGLNLIQRYGNQAAFLAAGDYHHHLGINTWAGVGAPPPTPDSPGLRHFTLAFPSGEALQATLAQLRTKEARVEELEDSFRTRDPSGNRIELVVAKPFQV